MTVSGHWKPQLRVLLKFCIYLIRGILFLSGKSPYILKINVCVNHFPFVCAILWPGHEYPVYSFIIHFYQEQVNKQSYNEKSDIWSLGCLVYELCSLSPPFTAMNQRSLEAKIRIGKFRPIPEHYSADLSEVVNSMLRLNVSLMCSGQWVCQIINLGTNKSLILYDVKKAWLFYGKSCHTMWEAQWPPG